MPFTPIVSLPVGLASDSSNLTAWPSAEAMMIWSDPSVMPVSISSSPSSSFMALMPFALTFP